MIDYNHDCEIFPENNIHAVFYLKGKNKMHVQKGFKKDHVLKKFVLGVQPIIQHFIEKAKIPEIIGTYLKTDKRRKIDTENILCLLIHNFLTSPTPLYEIQDWLMPIDARAVGLSEQDIGFIYDERVARALDDFYNSKHKDVFFHLSLRAIKVFELDCSQLHHDTTSITFSGTYKDWNAKEQLTHGHNKDHRPDLKQLVLGITVTADGAVPLLHEIHDGNQADDQVHITNHKRLQKLLACTDFIYVADSKLITDKNLSKIVQWGGRFVSVMPRTWKEDKQFRDAVRNDKVMWKHLLSRSNSRNPSSKKDHYYLSHGDYFTEQGYRLLWIRSTQKAGQDSEIRNRNINKVMNELRALQPKLNRYTLKTPEKIESKIKSIIKENGCVGLIQYALHEHQEDKHVYQEMGRPTASTPIKKIHITSFSISFSANIQGIEEQSKTDGVFPLITNLDNKEYQPKEVLEIYKFQPFLEKRHSQLKTYKEVAPVYLKNGERSVALLHMQVMALMIASLVERTLRLAMKKNAIVSLPIYPEGRPCKAPTMFDLARLFKGVERYEVTQSETVSIYPAQLNKIQKEVLTLLDIPISSYQ
jgi:transposase